MNKTGPQKVLLWGTDRHDGFWPSEYGKDIPAGFDLQVTYSECTPPFQGNSYGTGVLLYDVFFMVPGRFLKASAEQFLLYRDQRMLNTGSFVLVQSWFESARPKLSNKRGTIKNGLV